MGERERMSSRIGLAAVIAMGVLLVGASSAHADCGNQGGVTFDVTAIPAYPGPQAIFVNVSGTLNFTGTAIIGEPFCLPAGSYSLTSGLYPKYGANYGPGAAVSYSFGDVICVGATQATCSPSSFSVTEYFTGAGIHGSVKNNGVSVGPGVLLNVYSISQDMPIGFVQSYGPWTDTNGNCAMGPEAIGVLQSDYTESGSQTYLISISKDCSAIVTLSSNDDGQANLDCVDLPPCVPCWQAAGG